mmetsp:Transcript_41426/g.104124  ORF Transcript_41426/g.104124 Transcript_41426/m.104124 type:complete len:360 (-) Transcript_41426:553-1632(-)
MPALEILPERDPRLEHHRVQRCRELAQADDQRVHHLVHLVVGGDARCQDEPVQRHLHRGRVIGVVQHHADGRDGWAPDEAEHVAVECLDAGTASRQLAAGKERSAAELRPPRGRHAGAAPGSGRRLLQLDGVADDGPVQVLLEIVRQVGAVVDAAIVALELLQRHLLLHLIIVRVGVEHDHAVAQDVRGIRVAQRAGVLLVVARAKTVHDAVDLLRFARQLEGLQEQTQRPVEGHTRELKRLGEMLEDIQVEVVVILLLQVDLPQKSANGLLVQPGACAQEAGNGLGLQGVRKKVAGLKEEEALLGVPVEVISGKNEAALEVFLATHSCHPSIAMLRAAGKQRLPALHQGGPEIRVGLL